MGVKEGGERVKKEEKERDRVEESERGKGDIIRREESRVDL